MSSPTAFRIAQIAVLLAVAPSFNAKAQDLAQFEKRVTEFTLSNGLKFIVVERHDVPVIHFLIYADVGSVNEVAGITGISHIFEHMAFKGTTRIGTRNYVAEKAAMERTDQLFLEIKKERHKGAKADPTRLEELNEQFEAAQKECDQYPDHAYDRITEQEGDFGGGALTYEDYTVYKNAYPSNKLEFWMSVESERFYAPVLREFYKERDGVAEERRLHLNDPNIRLREEFFACAFKAHPYGVDVGGHMSDIQSITRAQAEAWFGKYYVASNLIVTMVGDVKPQEVRTLAETYFGRLPRKDRPGPVETVEPEQQGERRCTVVADAQPSLYVGYHRPAIDHPDSPVFDVISEILGHRRTSRLYQALVKERRIAVAVETTASASRVFHTPRGRDQTSDRTIRESQFVPPGDCVTTCAFESGLPDCALSRDGVPR